MHCYFASDLHGLRDRYEKLFGVLEQELPDALLLGGDLLPSAFAGATDRHIDGFRYLGSRLRSLQERVGARYPAIFAILGNDDPRAFEPEILALEEADLLCYLNLRRSELGAHTVYGYSYIPPSPFLMKDWERYDVSRFVDPGCVSPEEGWLSVEVDDNERRYSTIEQDLRDLTGDADLSRAILLCHVPPHGTRLDRAALDGVSVDHAPVDPHVGSIALRRLIEARQPFLTLHGHVHESARLTGSWRDAIGNTTMFSAGHDGPELALVRFDSEDLASATRELL